MLQWLGTTRERLFEKKELTLLTFSKNPKIVDGGVNGPHNSSERVQWKYLTQLLNGCDYFRPYCYKLEKYGSPDCLPNIFL